MMIIAFISSVLSLIVVAVAYFAALRRYDELMRRYDALKRDDDMLTKLQSGITELYATDERRQAEIANVKESFVSLNNKLASRSRTDRRASVAEAADTESAPGDLRLPEQSQGNGTTGKQIRFVRKY